MAKKKTIVRASYIRLRSNDPVMRAACEATTGPFLPGPGKQKATHAQRLEALNGLYCNFKSQGPSGRPVAITTGGQARRWYPPGTDTALKKAIETGYAMRSVEYEQGKKKGFKDSKSAAYSGTEKLWQALAGFDDESILIDPKDRVWLRAHKERRGNSRISGKRKTEAEVFRYEKWGKEEYQKTLPTILGYDGLIDRHEVSLDGVRLRSTLRLRRIFNSASAIFGGRFYSAFHSVKSGRKPSTLIGGEAVISADFSSLHPRLALAAFGIGQPLGDLYDAAIAQAGFDLRMDGIRDVAKQHLNAALNVAEDNEFDEYQPIPGKSSAGNDVLSEDELEKIRAGFLDRFPSLTPAFGKSLGLQLQWVESVGTRVILDAFIAADRPILSIHDGYLLLPQDRALFEEALPKAIRQMFESLKTVRRYRQGTEHGEDWKAEVKPGQLPVKWQDLETRWYGP